MHDFDGLAIVGLLVLTGFFTGILNMVAAGGSALVIPLLVALGLPPVLANTTNHVPALVGFASGAWKFHRLRVMPWRDGFRLAIPMTIGSLAGTYTASIVDDDVTQYVVVTSLVLTLALALAKPERWSSTSVSSGADLASNPWMWPFSVALGFWGGLVVVGAGGLLLALLVVILNRRISEANALKSLSLGLSLLPAVVLLAWRQDIVWSWAVPLSIGSIAGSIVGARLTLHPNVGVWAFRILLVVISGELVLEVWAMFRS
ncbi:MAG: hypothetical protein RL591_2328 [Planctomycetota bacterium]|jgi:uncharacterized membrane protein YfcA